MTTHSPIFRPAHRVPRFRLRCAPAFTLVEMLIVLVLVSLLVSGSLVNLAGRSQSLALRLAANDLTSAAAFASSHARSTHCITRLEISPDGDSWRLESLSSDLTTFIPLPGLAGHPHHLPAGIRITSTTDDPAADGILFLPTGAASHHSIQLLNRSLETLSFQLFPNSGQLHALKK